MTLELAGNKKAPATIAGQRQQESCLSPLTTNGMITMERQPEEIYQEIAQNIQRAIGDDAQWEEAWLDVEMQTDHSTIKAKYQVAGVARPHSFVAGYRTNQLFAELQAIMQQPGQVPWRQSQFKLWPDGRYEVAFQYP